MKNSQNVLASTIVAAAIALKSESGKTSFDRRTAPIYLEPYTIFLTRTKRNK